MIYYIQSYINYIDYKPTLYALENYLKSRNTSTSWRKKILFSQKESSIQFYTPKVFLINNSKVLFVTFYFNKMQNLKQGSVSVAFHYFEICTKSFVYDLLIWFKNSFPRATLYKYSSYKSFNLS